MRKAIAGILLLFVVLCIAFCMQKPKVKLVASNNSPAKGYNIRFDPSMQSIGNIPLPDGFQREHVSEKSFAAWLRRMPLKKNNQVFLYNKKLKPNQSSHFAVLDISTGDKDLQQCADALMRLKAEYLFAMGAYDQIEFITSDKTVMNFAEFAKGKRYSLAGQRLSSYHIANDLSCYTHVCLMQFLNWVFSYCSTYSLAMQSKQVEHFETIASGDVFVKAGSPGHAMLVSDVAVNPSTGKKIFLLVQGYMPAQDMHIVRNPSNPAMGPWYEVNDNSKIVTPGWTFDKSQLRRW